MMWWRMMESVNLQARVGEDGILRLEVPLDVKNAQLEVMVIVQQVTEAEAFQSMLASESALAREWDTPEEDAAWADL